jgi:hypothetical protein
MERMDLKVGPITIEVIEPLQKLKVTIAAPGDGLSGEMIFDGRAFPIEEPRFVRRNGPRTMMDYTRLTQNGRWSGWIERDGKRFDLKDFVGTRDRSWGVRPVGSRDTQEGAPPQPGQFFWIWSPCNFPSGSFFFHTNDDGEGEPWNRRAVWQPDGHPAREIKDCGIDITWKSGTRHAKNAVVRMGDNTVTFEPQYEFFMQGLGYGHPSWGHGANKGELAVEREDLKLSDCDGRMPPFLHVQALSKVTWRNGQGETQIGRGVLEQLVIGPHAPSGFKQMLDYAP